MDIEALIADPRIRWGALGAAALVLGFLLLRTLRAVAGRAKAASAARGRRDLVAPLRDFRDDLRKGVAEAGVVFRKVETETGYAAVIGHWRLETGHRFAIREPDFGALKAGARRYGLYPMPISDLEVAWRKVGRQAAAWDAGELDASTTPIVTVRVFERDLEKVVVLANMALQALEA